VCDVKPPGEVPAASPAPPVVERTQRIKILLGNKRYVLIIAVKAEQLKPPPAPVIEVPRSGG
jgi:hypothetical protein